MYELSEIASFYLIVYIVACIGVFACKMTDNGIYGMLCVCIGAYVANYCCNEIPEVGRLIGTTPAGT